ncbi:MAG TPA: nucleoside hydrolase [Acidimicrobiales bacterium]|nr:nucleoside hydrolase [Acidimicrobiales bacterium]
MAVRTFAVPDPERLVAALAPPWPADGPVDVIIDADPTNEIDDQFALVWAMLRQDRVHLVGLTAAPYSFEPEVLLGAGTASLDRRRLHSAELPAVSPAEGVENARRELVHICELMGAPVDLVVAGADRFMPAPTEAVPSAAAEMIVQAARAHRGGPLHIVGIGCATNIASALLLAPDIADRVVVTWTSAYPSFWPFPNASYNLALDLHASRLLFSSGVPLVYLPGYYVGEELRVTLPEIEAYVAGRGAPGDYLAEIYRSHGNPPHRPGRSKVLWDMINIAWLIEPSWLDTRLVPAPELDPTLHWTRPTPHHLMREATDLDRDAVLGDLYACLDGCATTE